MDLEQAGDRMVSRNVSSWDAGCYSLRHRHRNSRPAQKATCSGTDIGDRPPVWSAWRFFQMGEVEQEALLEWINSLEVVGELIQSLDELSNGKILLRVMNDVNPETFPERPSQGSELKVLLRGLVEHFRGRQGCAEAIAQYWLEDGHVTVSSSLLTQLVIWATLDNELPNHTRYIQTCQELSAASAAAVVLIAERFSLDVDASPVSCMIPGFLRRSTSGLSGSPAGALPRSVSAELPDFLEVGLDPETRFRRLKEHYIVLKEEQERWEEEKSRLMAEIESERAKRLEAQEKERLAQAELRLADESAERAREDQRLSLEMKLEQEVWKSAAELRQREQEVERLREEVEISRVQAQSNQKVHSQLEMYKKRLEECQVWKREKDELRKQLDEITTSRQAGSGTMEHLHARLASLRDDVASISRERDEARLQIQMLQNQIEKQTAQGPSGSDLPPSRGAQVAEPTSGPRPSGVLSNQLASARDPEQEKIIRDLKTRLDLRERELQVLHWRGQAESHALQAQESLMTSCFHELGLRYHQLQVQQEQLHKQLQAQSKKMHPHCTVCGPERVASTVAVPIPRWAGQEIPMPASRTSVLATRSATAGRSGTVDQIQAEQ